MRGWYRERPATVDLASELACSWTTTIGAAGHAILPDGCIDLMWLDDGRLVVCGPETASWQAGVRAGTEAGGVRFRPGVAPTALGVPAVELRNLRVPLADLWGTRTAHAIANRVSDARDPDARTVVLEGVVRERLAAAAPVDPVVRFAAARLALPRAEGITSLAVTVGLSQRQLHRRCTAAFGYGPATLARVLRLQRFFSLARRPRTSMGLAAPAHAAGYFDQAHLSRDCRALTGRTPSALLGLASDPSKTSPPESATVSGTTTLDERSP